MQENYTYEEQETLVKAQEDRGLMELKASHHNYKRASRTRRSDIIIEVSADSEREKRVSMQASTKSRF